MIIIPSLQLQHIFTFYVSKVNIYSAVQSICSPFKHSGTVLFLLWLNFWAKQS